VPHREKSLWESELQSLEKKIVCDKRDFEQTTTLLLAQCVPEVGMFKEKNIMPEPQLGKFAQFARSAQHSFSPRGAPQHRSHDPEQVSPKALSGDDFGQPIITRNTSRTKRAIAMSLKSVACGRAGQY